MRGAAVLLVFLIAGEMFGATIPTRRSNFRLSPTVAASCTNPPYMDYYWIARTNDTTARSTYRTAPTAGISSNVLYLIHEVHANSATVPDSLAVSNDVGAVVASLVGTRTNFNTLGSPTEQLSVWSFMTNVDVAAGRWCIGFAGNQTACGISVLAISNTACGDVGADAAAAIRQSMNWAATSSQPNPSNIFSAPLDASGSNIVVFWAGNNTTTFGVTSNAGSGLVAVDTNAISTPNTATWLGVATNYPVTATNYVITAGGSLWGTKVVEVASRDNYRPGIRSQPSNQTVVTNQTATFTTYALGGCEILYQWTRTNRVDGYTNIPSATASIYTTPATVLADSTDTFRCVLTNLYGGATSSVATLTVTVGSSTPTITTNSETFKVSSTGTTTTHAFTGLPAGSLLAVACASERDASSASSWAITDTQSLTWTCRGNNTTASTGKVQIWTAPFAAGGNVTVTATYSITDDSRSTACYVITGQNASQTWVAGTNSAAAPSIALTTSANSAVILVTSDWGAIDPGAGPTYRTPPTHVKMGNDFQSGQYTGYGYFVPNTGAGGAQTFGISTPSTMNLGGTLALQIIP